MGSYALKIQALGKVEGMFNQEPTALQGIALLC